MQVWAATLLLMGLVMTSCTPPSPPPLSPTSVPPSASVEFADLRSLSDPSPQVFQLPNGLKEVSGLAVASDQSVYAHDDEHGIIYEVDISTGKTGAIFALGDPTISSDFEGIAVHEGRIYVITSDGLLFESPIGAHQDRVRFNHYNTGVGEICEVEGLAVKSAVLHKPSEPNAENFDDSQFLILCKTPRQSAYENKINIFVWSFADRVKVPETFLSLDLDLLLTQDEQKKFYPSAIEWHAKSRSIFVISARNRQVVQLSEKGELISKRTLDKTLHPQSEGLTLMPNGDWVIADEAKKRGFGTLTRYRANR